MNKENDVKITLEDIITAKRMIEEKGEKEGGVTYDYGLDFVITKKENGLDVELPKVTDLEYALCKMEGLLKELNKIINKQSKESLKDQKQTLFFHIECITEAVEDAYSFPSKIDLLKMVNECIEHMESIQKDSDYYEKRYDKYYKKYITERKKNEPDFDEWDYYDEEED